MARNTYDIDEKLESPFNAKHLFRSLTYAKKYIFNYIIIFPCCQHKNQNFTAIFVAYIT